MTKRTVCIVSYLLPIGWIIAFLAYKKNSKSSLAKFHLEQSFGLAVFGVVTNLLFAIPLLIDSDFITLLLLNNMGLVVLWMAGLISALYGVRLPLPLIGFYFKNKFQFIQ